MRSWSGNPTSVRPAALNPEEVANGDCQGRTALRDHSPPLDDDVDDDYEAVGSFRPKKRAKKKASHYVPVRRRSSLSLGFAGLANGNSSLGSLLGCLDFSVRQPLRGLIHLQVLEEEESNWKKC